MAIANNMRLPAFHNMDQQFLRHVTLAPRFSTSGERPSVPLVKSIVEAKNTVNRLLMSIHFRAGILVFGLLIPLAAGAGDPGGRKPVREKLVMGWLESVFLKPWNLRVTAKLDTGAKTSSLHADRIDHFTKDGQEWVRFTLEGSDDRTSVVVERPLIRTAYIKERMSRSSKRDVVRMALCKNGRDYETEFTLVDRSNFNYPLLLGRSFLQDVALVDAAETFRYKADDDPCKSQSAPQPPQRKGK